MSLLIMKICKLTIRIQDIHSFDLMCSDTFNDVTHRFDVSTIEYKNTNCGIFSFPKPKNFQLEELSSVFILTVESHDNIAE